MGKRTVANSVPYIKSCLLGSNALAKIMGRGNEMIVYLCMPGIGEERR